MKLRKVLSLLLVLILTLSLAVTTYAQQVDSGAAGAASITIPNASKGETYTVVKLFDVSVSGIDNGSIAYTGDIPTALSAFFRQEHGYIVIADDINETEYFAALKQWASSQTPTAYATSIGGELTFTNLPYGYYVISTTQGAAVTVDSTNLNATAYDKNSLTPDLIKDVDDRNVFIGQTVTYTLTASTSNYLGNGAASEIVTRYEIEDTLPDFLTDVNVTGIVVNQPKGEDVILDIQQFGEDKTMEFVWVDSNYASLYENGSEIIVTYTAKVTDQAVVDGDGNKNISTLTAYTTPLLTTPSDAWEEVWSDEEIIYTYASALQKVDENKTPLAGAQFQSRGLSVTGAKGVYTVTDLNSADSDYGTVMETDDEGQLVILGLPSDVTLTVSESKAPAGYNILTEPVSLTPVITGEEIKATVTTVYYDENGNVTDTQTDIGYQKTTYNIDLLKQAIVVVNQAGVELPSTGGIGTTVFYIIGSTLLLAAIVMLVVKKRMADNS